jgi:AraC family transcriptional regulator
MKPTYTLADVRIVQFPETHVAAFEHRGDPKTVPESVRRFIEWRREVGLTPRTSATFNVFWDNPEVVGPDAYRMDICAGTTREISANAFGVVNKTIPAGRCALLRHIGPDPLTDTIRYLYLDWLPTSGETPRDFPLFAQRVALAGMVPEHEAITDICLPVN